MIRILIVVASLSVSGCAVAGLPSAVDAIPLAARMPAPLPDGDFCWLDDDEDGRLIIRSHRDEGEARCVALRWDAPRQVYGVRGVGDETKPPGELAFADLGAGLLLIQFYEPPSGPTEASEKAWMYLLVVGAAHGEALAVLPLFSDERIVALAAAYPGISLQRHNVPFMGPGLPEDAPPDAEPPPSPHRYVSAGSPEDIRHLARDIAVMMLEGFDVQYEGAKAPEPGVFAPVLIRTEAGRPDHPPTPEQTRDIDAVMMKLVALKDF